MLGASIFMKTKKQFWITPKQYSKCYNIIWHFKLHSFHVYQFLFSHISLLYTFNTKYFYQQAWYLKLYFITYLQAIISELSSVYLTTNFVPSANDYGFLWYIWLHQYVVSEFPNDVLTLYGMFWITSSLLTIYEIGSLRHCKAVLSAIRNFLS